MSLVIPPGFAQCYLRWRLTADPEEMVSTIAVDTAGMTDPTDIAGVVVTSFQNSGAFPAATHDSSYTFVGVTAYLGQDGPDPLVGEWIVNTQGTVSRETLPNNSALLIRKSTSIGGRRGRGRMYWPPWYVTEANVSENGVLSPGDQTAMATRLTAFLGLLDTAPLGGAVLLHDEATLPVTAPTPITALTLQPVIATQRQRLRR